jgi:hypothetical protein
VALPPEAPASAVSVARKRPMSPKMPPRSLASPNIGWRVLIRTDAQGEDGLAGRNNRSNLDFLSSDAMPKAALLTDGSLQQSCRLCMTRYDFSSSGELAEIAFEPVRCTLNWLRSFVRFPPRLAMPTELPIAPPKVQPKARSQFSCSSPLALLAPLACEHAPNSIPTDWRLPTLFSSAISRAESPIGGGRPAR